MLAASARKPIKPMTSARGTPSTSACHTVEPSTHKPISPSVTPLKKAAVALTRSDRPITARPRLAGPIEGPCREPRTPGCNNVIDPQAAPTPLRRQRHQAAYPAAGFYSATQQHHAAAPMAYFLTAAYTTARAAPTLRPERHTPNSISTLRTVIAVALANELPRCPCCMRKRDVTASCFS